jgi:hypothetical protein
MPERSVPVLKLCPYFYNKKLEVRKITVKLFSRIYSLQGGILKKTAGSRRPVIPEAAMIKSHAAVFCRKKFLKYYTRVC